MMGGTKDERWHQATTVGWYVIHVKDLFVPSTAESDILWALLKRDWPKALDVRATTLHADLNNVTIEYLIRVIHGDILTPANRVGV